MKGVFTMLNRIHPLAAAVAIVVSSPVWADASMQKLDEITVEAIREAADGHQQPLEWGKVYSPQYTLGAVIYALQRPNPFPRVFGYHEVFHVLVVAALALHYAAVGVVAFG